MFVRCITIFVLWVLAFPVYAASFDCAKSSNETEISICADPELSALDDMLAIIWQEYISKLVGVFPITDGSITSDPLITEKQAKREQITWVKQAQKCGGDQSCIKNIYSSRISELSSSVFDSQGNNTSNYYRRYFKRTAAGCSPSSLSVDAFYDEVKSLCYEIIPNSRYVSLKVAGGVAVLSYYEISPGYYDCTTVQLLQFLTDKKTTGSSGYWVQKYDYSQWGDETKGMRKLHNNGSRVELNLRLQDGIKFEGHSMSCGMRNFGLSGGRGFGE